MEFLKAHQLSAMLFLSGMCGILAVMTIFARFLPQKTKRYLICMQISAMLLLLFERFAYKYQGVEGDLGYFMVRISNGMVFLLMLVIVCLVTRLLIDVYRNNGKLQNVPIQLMISDVVFTVGVLLLIISQFTGIYYSFDEHNVYQRGGAYLLSYIIPAVMIALQIWTIVQYRSYMKRKLAILMVSCISLPVIAAVVQYFFYGVSFIDLTLAIVVIAFYTYELSYLGDTVDKARLHELQLYKEGKERESAMFEQTAEALASAIDAKDKYTSGHSARVALYSREIAEAAGLPKTKCEQVYFAALLHDVGKIGIRHDIINKVGKLTDDEFRQIKEHPALGDQILSEIKLAPFLCVGARSHHERFDGKGYPDGLAGKDIPEIARIIAVADAYDAMTSYRSYRAPLKEEVVRSEIEKGIGTQFDPEFAKIMLKIMDREDAERKAQEQALDRAKEA